MPDGSRRGTWLVVGLGVGAAVCWVLPLIQPHGLYAGYYGYRDVIVGFVLTLVWLAALAVRLSPERWRRPLAIRLTTVLGALLLTTAVCDIGYTVAAVKIGHFWYGSMYIPRAENEPDRELIWKNRPGLVWRGQKSSVCYRIDLRNDENGFRNPMGVRQSDV